jgi:hypothetical protein
MQSFTWQGHDGRNTQNTGAKTEPWKVTDYRQTSSNSGKRSVRIPCILTATCLRKLGELKEGNADRKSS